MVTMDIPKPSWCIGRCSVQHMGAEAAIIAAPTACTKRHAMSMGKSDDSPHRREPKAKIPRPAERTLRTPVWAAILAKGMMSAERTRR